MSEASERYAVDGPQEDDTPDTPGKNTFTTASGAIFIWGADGAVEIAVPVHGLPNPQAMASLQVPLSDVLEFVAKGVVLPVRHQLLDQLSDVELLLGEVPGAAPPPEHVEVVEVPASRERPTVKIHRPGT